MIRILENICVKFKQQQESSLYINKLISAEKTIVAGNKRIRKYIVFMYLLYLCIHAVSIIKEYEALSFEIDLSQNCVSSYKCVLNFVCIYFVYIYYMYLIYTFMPISP